MSKAFTKESDAESTADNGAEADDEGAASGLPAGARNYMTPEGARKLREELQFLLKEERPKVVQTVSWAASNGDRSENGDYIYGKRRLREIDRRIRFLTRRLDIAEVIDPAKQRGDQVLFGARVSVRGENGVEHVYQIVGIDESDPASRRISWISPLARALLNRRVGDYVVFKKPAGEEELEIVSVEYR